MTPEGDASAMMPPMMIRVRTRRVDGLGVEADGLGRTEERALVAAVVQRAGVAILLGLSALVVGTGIQIRGVALSAGVVAVCDIPLILPWAAQSIVYGRRLSGGVVGPGI